MTVIAWDGTYFAADKRSVRDGLQRTVAKIHRHHKGEWIAAYTGDADHGEELLAWLEAGACPSNFPDAQRDKDGWCVLMVVFKEGAIWQFERTPFPIKFDPQPFAIGSGRDYALAAMACGKNAAIAVQIACRFDTGCGNGVDVATFETNKIISYDLDEHIV